jgi:hypothetical protein
MTQVSLMLQNQLVKVIYLLETYEDKRRNNADVMEYKVSYHKADSGCHLSSINMG